MESLSSEGCATQSKHAAQVDFGGQHTLLVVTGNGAESRAADAAANGTAAPANGVATGVDMDTPVQAEDVALPENGILAGIILPSILGYAQYSGRLVIAPLTHALTLHI